MPAPFDSQAFLSGLDAIFAAGRALEEAEPYLREAAQAASGPDLLLVLNESMGFLRSVGRHEEAVEAARQARTLAESLGLDGSEAHATTLINVATALRAAGLTDDARAGYRDALAAAERALPAGDRRLAALHNNLSLLHSEEGELEEARAELTAALGVLEAATVDPDSDLDIASTLGNLALVEFRLRAPDRAGAAVERALAIIDRGGHQRNPHFAGVLAAHGEASMRLGRADDAVRAYAQALSIIGESYGRGSEAYAVTAANLDDARAALAAAAAPPAAASSPAPPADGPPARALDPHVPGLELSRRYWERHGRPLLERYPELRGRVAAGLVGHGSDCYGFDDASSRDHDWGPGFCLWLTAEDHAAWGERLQADYDALPREFEGFPARERTPRGAGRVGVFETGEFFASLTGHRGAPASAHEWLALDEATLAAATNGAVFADPLGAFSGVRGGFLRMPEDVRLALVSRRLGMMSQAGQYNVPRMLARGDGAAAWLAVSEYVAAASSLVFLLNRPTSAGYLPYYKWQFAALRALAQRPATRLPAVVGELETAVRLASAACLGGAGFGEGGAGAGAARAGLEQAIERVCALVVPELRVQGLSGSDAAFLEHHRGELARRISDPWLAAL